eukprot:4040570-Prymnesium_polylepis.1
MAVRFWLLRVRRRSRRLERGVRPLRCLQSGSRAVWLSGSGQAVGVPGPGRSALCCLSGRSARSRAVRGGTE